MIRSGWRLALAGLLMAVLIGVQAQEPARPSGDAEPQDHQHQHDFPATVNDFHHTLARLWHAQPGDERSRAVCERASELRSLAHKVESAPLPERARDDSTGWNRAVRHMVESTDQLVAVCSGANHADAERALGDIHQAFHGLVAYLGHRH